MLTDDLSTQTLAVIIIGLLLIFSKPAHSQPTEQTLTLGGSTSVTSALNWNQMPSDITIAAGSFTPPRKIILRKSKDCRLVVLNDTTEQIEIGCRTELSK